MTLSVQILIFMTISFVLGAALGWLLWRFGVSATAESEVEFWKDRFNKSRQQYDNSQNRVEALERDKEKLKQRYAQRNA